MATKSKAAAPGAATKTKTGIKVQKYATLGVEEDEFGAVSNTAIPVKKSPAKKSPASSNSKSKEKTPRETPQKATPKVEENRDSISSTQSGQSEGKSSAALPLSGPFGKKKTAAGTAQSAQSPREISIPSRAGITSTRGESKDVDTSDPAAMECNTSLISNSDHEDKADGVPSGINSPVDAPELDAVPTGPEEILGRSAIQSNAFPLAADQLSADQFVKIRLLGRGAIGKVYLVRLKDDVSAAPKLYAVKVLSKQDMMKRNKVARVMTEREILATVNHPCIVSLYASFHTPTRLYLVLEYMAGGELYKLIQKQPGKRLNEDVVRFYGAHILMALEYLHHLGFVYRDLKPENVLIREDGHLALADFDLSKQGTALAPKVTEKKHGLMNRLKNLGGKDDITMDDLNLTQQAPVLAGNSNSFVGTEEYLAPEVINGTQQTAAVDWWTFGILLYEMLYGATPFRGATQDETFKNILNEDLKFPSEVAASRELKDLLKRLLNRDEAKRLGTTGGADEVKNHKFFASLNFALIRNLEAPLIPSVPTIKNYAEYTTTLADMDTGAATVTSQDGEAAGDTEFKNFSTIRTKNVTY